MQQDLNWPILQQRRQKSRLALFYKAMQNTIALQIPPYYNSIQIVLQDIIKIIYLSSIQVHKLMSTYSYSYFPKNIKEWNSLTGDTVWLTQ